MFCLSNSQDQTTISIINVFFNNPAASNLSTFMLLLANLLLFSHSHLCCKGTSFSASYPLRLPGPFLLSCFLVGWFPAYIGCLKLLLVQDFELTLLNAHEVPARPFFQPVKVPSDCSTALWYTIHSSRFCVICNHLVICNPSVEKHIKDST